MSNYFLILRTAGRQAVNANCKFIIQLCFFSCIMLARELFPDYKLPDFFINVMTTSYRFKLATVELDKGYSLNSCHFKLQLWYIVLRSARTSRCKMIFRRTLVVFSRRRFSRLTFLRVLCLQTNECPIVAYRRDKLLKDLLVRARTPTLKKLTNSSFSRHTNILFQSLVRKTNTALI